MNVIDRFLHYVSFSTASDEAFRGRSEYQKSAGAGPCPVRGLKELGIGDAVVDEFGRVYGHLRRHAGP